MLLLACLLILLTLVSPQGLKCPFNSIPSPDDSSLCFSIISPSTSWATAESLCNYRGGHLVSIANQQESDFVYDLVDEHPINSTMGYFLGAIYTQNEWKWIDGTSFTYTNFDSQQSVNPVEGSILIVINRPDKTSSWLISNQTLNTGFICKVPLCSDINLPTILDTSKNYSGLYFGSASQSFYVGFPRSEASFQVDTTNCMNIGGYLPSIANAFVNSEVIYAVQILLNQPSVRLGYFSYGTGSPWVWTDGTVSFFTNWAPGEPKLHDDIISYAVLQTSSGRWTTDLEISTLVADYYYICELPIPRKIC